MPHHVASDLGLHCLPKSLYLERMGKKNTGKQILSIHGGRESISKDTACNQRFIIKILHWHLLHTVTVLVCF